MEVRNLTFSYTEGGKIILNDISFKIKEGSITSILGANGCGKSTLFDLMTKNLKVNSGQILLNGRNIESMSQKEFARKVAIIHQYNRVSNDITVRQLVSYGRTPYQVMMKRHDDEDERMINWAIEATNLVDIQDRTVNSLSGGQKQRISIARVFLKNPPILILDEATSALDNNSEAIVQQSLEILSKGRTTITIAHRLSTIRNASKILVLTENGIEESGTHEELMNKEGIYFNLYNKNIDELKE